MFSGYGTMPKTYYNPGYTNNYYNYFNQNKQYMSSYGSIMNPAMNLGINQNSSDNNILKFLALNELAKNVAAAKKAKTVTANPTTIPEETKTEPNAPAAETTLPQTPSIFGQANLDVDQVLQSLRTKFNITAPTTATPNPATNLPTPINTTNNGFNTLGLGNLGLTSLNNIDMSTIAGQQALLEGFAQDKINQILNIKIPELPPPDLGA